MNLSEVLCETTFWWIGGCCGKFPRIVNSFIVWTSVFFFIFFYFDVFPNNTRTLTSCCDAIDNTLIKDRCTNSDYRFMAIHLFLSIYQIRNVPKLFRNFAWFRYVRRSERSHAYRILENVWLTEMVISENGTEKKIFLSSHDYQVVNDNRNKVQINCDYLVTVS